LHHLYEKSKEGYNYEGPQYENILQDQQVWDVLGPEYFGNNRSALEWNEKDYPMKTTNGLNLTSLFPQDSLYDEGLYIPRKFSSVI
jgi:hypothetical protein